MHHILQLCLATKYFKVHVRKRNMAVSISSFLSNHNNFAHEFELQPQGVPGLIDVMDTPRVGCMLREYLGFVTPTHDVSLVYLRIEELSPAHLFVLLAALITGLKRKLQLSSTNGKSGLNYQDKISQNKKSKPKLQNINQGDIQLNLVYTGLGVAASQEGRGRGAAVHTRARANSSRGETVSHSSTPVLVSEHTPGISSTLASLKKGCSLISFIFIGKHTEVVFTQKRSVLIWTGVTSGFLKSARRFGWQRDVPLFVGLQL